ncbi:MAG TPA: HK97 family phage prohead protease [Atopostipes sp.]|nr:HK97 family phage prohead protease [Atopostipes sp.]
MKNLEIRSFGGDAAPIISERTIEGYAIVFNQWSEIMYDPEGKRFFREKISQSAVTDELINRSDIKALVEHNRERLLARYNKGKGTLVLTIDEHGLRYKFEAPNTDDGNYAVEMVSRGDINGSSFAFSAIKGKDDVWVKGDDRIFERTINNIRFLSDVTITSDPAYSQTEVNVRSLEEMEQPEKKEVVIPKPYKVKIEKLRMNIH